MAIDFPEFPTLNQMFTSSGRTWKWTGIRWEIIVLNADTLDQYYTSQQVDDMMTGYTAMSDTPPQTAIPGSRWFKTSTAQEYMYYNNGWIEV